MIKLLQHTEINTEKWSQLLETSPHASFFQTKECYDFYCSLTFMKGFVYAVEEDNQLVGLMCGYLIADGGKVKRFFSRRAIVPGGLLLHESISDKSLSSLLKFSQRQLAKQAIYIEIRNYTDYSRWKSIFDNNRFSYQPHLNFHVETIDTERSLQKMSSTKRRDVRLSLREGAEIVHTKDVEDIKQFYVLLYDMYRTRIKTPLFPFEFFENVALMSFGKLFVIKYNNRIIGGNLCVELPHKILYEWFVCGEDRKYKNIFPSTLATWAAIEHAANNGFKYFDMMGAGKPDETYGVREFKSKFGGELVEHGRFLNVMNPCLYNVGKKVVKFLKKRK
ncbi:MAG: aminoacyltransferase [Pigmentiphaga sp.]|nr:aminoacyltransferase [Pigmentiphaga sp.]